MSLLVFPGICLYFLIGSFLGKVFKTDSNDELEDVIWFVFWPMIIATIILLIFLALVDKILNRLFKILVRFHRYMTTY